MKWVRSSRLSWGHPARGRITSSASSCMGSLLRAQRPVCCCMSWIPYSLARQLDDVQPMRACVPRQSVHAATAAPGARNQGHLLLCTSCCAIMSACCHSSGWYAAAGRKVPPLPTLPPSPLCKVVHSSLEDFRSLEKFISCPRQPVALCQAEQSILGFLRMFSVCSHKCCLI